MECQFCSAPATVHLTDIIHKKKRETHLCEACAREKNLLPGSPNELNIPALLHLVLGQLPVPAKPATPHDVVCPECGIPYAHFRAQGRLGCPHDYEVFRPLLEPLLERLQNSANRHEGKVPRRHARRMRAARRAELEARLRTAVTNERYEEAAALRDEIRGLGADHES
jgi:protein arginine kinase activator